MEPRNKGGMKENKDESEGPHLSLFTECERRKIAQYDLERFVYDNVSSELFEDSFPERGVVWKQMQGAQLEEMIEELSQR